MRYTFGLDLGGTNIKAGLLSEEGQVVERRTIPTEAGGGPEHVMDRLAGLVEDLQREAGIRPAQIVGLGIGTPGPTDEHGCVIQAPNLPGWTNVPLRDGLVARTRLRVRVMNDANAAAYGEYRHAARSEPALRHLILLTLGTGVGGGVISHGQLFAGAHEAGGELGHTIVELMGRPCSCGQRGCVEPYASATAIAGEARRRVAAGRPSSLPSDPTCEQVFEAAAGGDRLADEVIDEAATYLGAACVNYVRAFDPQRIVLGGGVVAAGESLIGRVREAFHRFTWRVRPESVQIARAALGNEAGFIGAALQAGRGGEPEPPGRGG